jgi:hypothetical protein
MKLLLNIEDAAMTILAIFFHRNTELINKPVVTFSTAFYSGY